MEDYELPINEMDDFQLLEKAKELSSEDEASDVYMVSLFVVLLKKLKIDLPRSTRIVLREGKRCNKKVTVELFIKLCNKLGDSKKMSMPKSIAKKGPNCTLGHIIFIDAFLNAAENRSNLKIEVDKSRNNLIDITKH